MRQLTRFSAEVKAELLALVARMRARTGWTVGRILTRLGLTKARYRDWVARAQAHALTDRAPIAANREECSSRGETEDMSQLSDEAIGVQSRPLFQSKSSQSEERLARIRMVLGSREKCPSVSGSARISRLRCRKGRQK